MPQQVATALDPVFTQQRTRADASAADWGKPFWTLLSEHGPDRARGASTNADAAEPDQPADAASEASEEASAAAEDQAEKAKTRTSIEVGQVVIAELQPLTIHSLNIRLLRGAEQPQTHLNAAKGLVEQSGPLNAEAGNQRGLEASVASRPAEAVTTRPQTGAPFSAGQDRRETVGGDRQPNRPLEQHTSKTELRPVGTDAAKQQATTQPAAVSASAAAPVAAAGNVKSPDAGVQRITPTPSAPSAAPIAASGGRNAGADAQLSRWLAQKPTQAGGPAKNTQRVADAVAAQTAKGLATALTRSDGAVTLRLNPESLGFIRIKLTMGKESLTARIEASSDQARRLLEQTSETLRASLEAKGWSDPEVHVQLLREADPALDMLKRLEHQGDLELQRRAAQDAAAESNNEGARGGDRGHREDRSSLDGSPDDHGDATDSIEEAGGPLLIDWARGVDTFA